MKYLDKKIAKRLDEKLKKLNNTRPFPEPAVRKLREHMQIEMTYNSNAIEGNSLTLKETFLVVNEGMTVKGKPLKDHLEAKDHSAALKYLYELVESGGKNTISERLIRSLHQLIVRETDKEWAGVYRNSNVFIGGADHTPPDALDVPKEMSKFIDWIKKNQKKLHIVELAALLHHRLVYIHPFFDGNGRTARMVMNIFLMQKGFPLVIILKNDRKKYYNVLSKADKGDYKPIVSFVAQAVLRSLDVYLKAISPIGKEREKYLTLALLAKQTPYSAKYLNLLARQGKLEAYKEKRNWLSTKEAVKRYIEERERKREV